MTVAFEDRNGNQSFFNTFDNITIKNLDADNSDGEGSSAFCVELLGSSENRFNNIVCTTITAQSQSYGMYLQENNNQNPDKNNFTNLNISYVTGGSGDTCIRMFNFGDFNNFTNLSCVNRQDDKFGRVVSASWRSNSNFINNMSARQIKFDCVLIGSSVSVGPTLIMDGFRCYDTKRGIKVSKDSNNIFRRRIISYVMNMNHTR